MFGFLKRWGEADKASWCKEWQSVLSLGYLDFVFRLKEGRQSIPSITDITEHEREILHTHILQNFEAYIYGFGRIFISEKVPMSFSKKERSDMIVAYLKSVRNSATPVETLLSYL